MARATRSGGRSYRPYSRAGDNVDRSMRAVSRLGPLVLSVAACSFPEPPPIGGDGGDDVIDADPRIASTAAEPCGPASIVCDEATERYVDCGPTGVVELAMDCPLGCASGVEKCLDVRPS